MLKKEKFKKLIIVLGLSLGMILTGCSSIDETNTDVSDIDQQQEQQEQQNEDTTTNTEVIITSVTTKSNGKLDTSNMFTERDLTQSVDYSNANYITLQSGQDVTISSEGVYVLSGNVNNVTVIVDADSSDKVQLVLDGVSISNTSKSAIYVTNADKVFITTVADSTLEVTGSFGEDGDAVIYAKDDIVLNGTASLTINSVDKGINGKDDVKITGGTYVITSSGKGIDGTDSIRIADGTITIKSSDDAIHASNDEDDSLGYVYIAGGNINITTSDDGIHADSVVQIDGGTINITNSYEGIEATYVQINGGTIDIYATDDGINATNSSTSYNVVVEFTGGTTTVKVGAGDTDCVDSNGNIIVSGGTIYLTGTSTWDFDGIGTYNGGTIYENGNQTNSVTNSMNMGGGMFGGGGQPGGGGFGGGPGRN